MVHLWKLFSVYLQLCPGEVCFGYCSSSSTWGDKEKESTASASLLDETKTVSRVYHSTFWELTESYEMETWDSLLGNVHLFPFNIAKCAEKGRKRGLWTWWIIARGNEGPRQTMLVGIIPTAPWTYTLGLTPVLRSYQALLRKSQYLPRYEQGQGENSVAQKSVLGVYTNPLDYVGPCKL